MRRRDMLLGLSGTAVTGCSTPFGRKHRGRILTPVPKVKVQRGRILHNVVGLRPHRDGGYKLSQEIVGDKYLIHNYGHSGDGVSLSWGCAQIAAEMAHERGSDEDIAIIGSGVMGLTTAFLLTQWGHSVTIYADKFPPHTTSNIAGALILYPDDTPERIRRFAITGWERFVDRPLYGVKRVSHRWLGHKGTDKSAEGFLGRRVRSEGPRVMVDPGIYLKRLMADVQIQGGKLFTKRFETAAEVLDLEEPTIINCTGLGAGALFNDEAVVPVRGQLTLLKPQPEIDYTYIAREPGFTSLYMFPRETAIVLGGTRDRGDWSLEVDPNTVAEMLTRHGEMASWAGGAPSAGA